MARSIMLQGGYLQFEEAKLDPHKESVWRLQFSLLTACAFFFFFRFSMTFSSALKKPLTKVSMSDDGVVRLSEIADESTQGPAWKK